MLIMKHIYHGDRDRLAASIILCDGELEKDEEELFEEYDGGLFCYHSGDVKAWTDMIETIVISYRKCLYIRQKEFS